MNSMHLHLWWDDRKGFFLACPPNNLLAWRWYLMVVLETWWPVGATFLWNSPTVIIGELFASLIILLAVRVLVLFLQRSGGFPVIGLVWLSCLCLLDMSSNTPRSLVCTFQLFPGLHGFQLDLTSLLVCYLPDFSLICIIINSLVLCRS